jgi:branched-chain amino acid transport system substrate-binding protein
MSTKRNHPKRGKLSGQNALTRRNFLWGAGVAGAAAGLNGLLPGRALAQTGPAIKIGYVSPQTGPLAPFGAADNFVIGELKTILAAGVKIAGKTHPVTVIVSDSQSDPNRAAEVAANLILKEEVQLMLVASTPETVNPAADQCEINGIPCVSSVVPWQPYFFGRGGNPAKGFDWTYHFFWGLEDIIAVFLNMWNSLPTNKVVGALYPNDGDGNAWGDPQRGFPPALIKAGYQIVDPGRYQNLTDDYSSYISAFKKADVQIVTGVPIPPDFTTFWNQAAQQGFRPKIATVGKALLFPDSVQALGTKGVGLSSEIWWTPHHPFRSSLTGQTARQLATEYTRQTKKQWTQPLGFVHTLFEIAIDALKRTPRVGDHAALRDAVKSTRLDTIVGSVSWAKGPVPNVAKTPLVGGQWVKGTDFPYDLTITNNELAPNIPAGGKLRPL